jgi:hypothetical protein
MCTIFDFIFYKPVAKSVCMVKILSVNCDGLGEMLLIIFTIFEV